MKTFSLRDPAFLGTTAGPSGPYASQPDDYGTLVRWFDASDWDGGAFSDGDDMTSNWIDKVIADPAVPSAGAAAPVYKDTVFADSKSSFIMDGPSATTYFRFTEVTLGDATFIVVMKPRSDTYALTRDGVDNYQIRVTGNSTTNQSTIYPNAAPSLVGDDSVPGINYGIGVHGWTRDGTTGVPLFYQNKNQFAETTADTNTTDLIIGQMSGYPFAGSNWDVAEVCIYSTVLSQADYNQLYDDYFAVKFLADL